MITETFYGRNFPGVTFVKICNFRTEEQFDGGIGTGEEFVLGTEEKVGLPFSSVLNSPFVE
jgi:hypothetical protein